MRRPGSLTLSKAKDLLPALFTMLLVLSSAVAETPVMVARHIYPEPTAARSDIAAALVEARREHKRVIVDFGGDWCGDCQVLDIYFQRPENPALLNQNFVLVHVNVGHIDDNLDLGAKYGVNLKRGVPALAVLDASGRPLYAQTNGEFGHMRTMQSDSVKEFLTTWKPARGERACRQGC